MFLTKLSASECRLLASGPMHPQLLLIRGKAALLPVLSHSFCTRHPRSRVMITPTLAPPQPPSPTLCSTDSKLQCKNRAHLCVTLAVQCLSRYLGQNLHFIHLHLVIIGILFLHHLCALQRVFKDNVYHRAIHST